MNKPNKEKMKGIICMIKVHYPDSPICIGYTDYSSEKNRSFLDFHNTEGVHNYLQVLCLLHDVVPRYGAHPLVNCLRQREHRVYIWNVDTTGTIHGRLHDRYKCIPWYIRVDLYIGHGRMKRKRECTQRDVSNVRCTMYNLVLEDVINIICSYITISLP